MHQITSYDQFQGLLDDQADRILFKHSPTCGISQGAYQEVETAIADLGLDNVWLLDVLHTDDLKYSIADALEIQHESPQVIIFQKGKVATYANHRAITKQRLSETLPA